MVKTASTMLPLGTKAFSFSLVDTITDEIITLKDDENYKATVIMFICNHCPYVKHIIQHIVNLAVDYHNNEVRFLAINSNDTVIYPDDSPENMKRIGIEKRFPFPYLFDETQEVAQAYQATCTPDFFVFDRQLSLIYRGQFDDSRPGNEILVTGDSIRDALNNILSNVPINPIQKPSIGCNIKWKS